MTPLETELKIELRKKNIELKALSEELKESTDRQADMARKFVKLLNLFNVPFDKQIELINIWGKL